ncbi:MAG: SRPBCC family protein, partial [Chloroflexota bacterium]
MTTVVRVTQLLISAPIQKVFNYISDLTKHPEWSGGELRIEAVSSDPIGVGKQYVSHGEVATQKNRPNQLEVSEYDSPRKFSFVAIDPDFGKVYHVFTFAEQRGGVMVRRTVTLNLNPFVAFVFRLIVYP